MCDGFFAIPSTLKLIHPGGIEDEHIWLRMESTITPTSLSLVPDKGS